MEAKEFLRQYGRARAEIAAIDKNIKRIQDEIKSLGDVSVPSVWGDGQPHGIKISDPTGTNAIRIAEKYKQKHQQLVQELRQYEYDMITRRSELWQLHMEILDVLSQIDDVTLYRILTYHYIEGRRFEWIAVEIGYTWRHIIRLHGQALKAVDKIIGDKNE